MIARVAVAAARAEAACAKYKSTRKAIIIGRCFSSDTHRRTIKSTNQTSKSDQSSKREEKHAKRITEPVSIFVGTEGDEKDATVQASRPEYLSGANV